jgi:hypothetical protein
VIAAHPRRATRKATRSGDASSSQADEEAANVAEGQAIREARDVRASYIIQKVERPLQDDYEYTLRRVDRHHPCRPTEFTKEENQSMINRHENPYEWTTELHDYRFWNNFQADWYLTVIKDWKNPITHQLFVDWSTCRRSVIPCSTELSPKLRGLGYMIFLACIKNGIRS